MFAVRTARVFGLAFALCFLAGANSIFIGDVLLTTKNPQTARDTDLLGRLGISSQLDNAVDPKTSH